MVDVARRAFVFEPDPSVQHQRGQAVARFAAERRRRVEAAAELRRVDAEQPHAADGRHVDRVAVDDRSHEHRLATASTRAAERGCLKDCNSRQRRAAIRICIRDSIWRGIARIADAAVQERTPRLAGSDTGRSDASSTGPTPCSGRIRYPSPALADELVAEAVDGEDEFGGLGVGLDLLTQTGDVHVDGPRQRHLVVAPHVRQQRVARQRRAAMLDEVPQQLELARRQLDGLAAARDLLRRKSTTTSPNR